MGALSGFLTAFLFTVAFSGFVLVGIPQRSRQPKGWLAFISGWGVFWRWNVPLLFIHAPAGRGFRFPISR